jgi:quercetin dioxygenase-like cupin family protein
MKTYNWDAVPLEILNPRVSRKVIHTERMTIAQLFLKKGAVVPVHSHDNEQVTTMISGSLRFDVAGETVDLGPGDMLPIPPNAPHGVETLEDSVAIDFFTPRREDWIRGDDAYLRK